MAEAARRITTATLSKTKLLYHTVFKEEIAMEDLKIRIQARHHRNRLIARNGRNSFVARLLERMTDAEVCEQARLHHERSVEFIREQNAAEADA
jgi:hypothetical protein